MAIFISTIVIILDQVTKLLAIKYLKNKNPYIIINQFFEFNYVENQGAAFGILKHKRLFFIVTTFLVLTFIAVYLIKNYKILNKVSILTFSLLIGGAAGNLIDRIRFGYVVDFLSFRFFNRYDFPVFNFADICIVISTGIIVFLVLFDKFEV